jgi:hypothetical protein
MTITIDLKTGKVTRISPLRALPEELARDFHGLFPARDGEEAELRNVRSRLLMKLAMEKEVYVEHGRLKKEVEDVLNEHVKVRYGPPKKVRRAEKKEAALIAPRPRPAGIYR